MTNTTQIEEDETDGYFHNEDGSREMCPKCCEYLLDDFSCPDPDCEHNHCDEEDE